MESQSSRKETDTEYAPAGNRKQATNTITAGDSMMTQPAVRWMVGPPAGPRVPPVRRREELEGDNTQAATPAHATAAQE
jgi:hypothetical protein